MTKLQSLLIALMLLCCVSANAQYNPTNPGEPGVYYTLKLKCDPESAGSFNIGTQTVQSQGVGVNLGAYTNTGYKFLHWEENGKTISSSPSFNYTMPGYNTTLIARYEYNPSSPEEPQQPNLPEYRQLTFNISPSEGGYLNTSANNKYEVGASVKLQAYNNNNFYFLNWTQEGEIISTSSSFNYVVKDSNAVITANFQYSPGNPGEPNKPTFQRRLHLQCNPQGGGYFNINSGNLYTSGSNVALKAYANKDYVFKNWTLDGKIIADNYSINYTMPETDVCLVANYEYVYSPNNPNEPNSPSDQELNIYGMTESIYLGQTINYPIYLRNNQEVYGLIVDINFPEAFEIDLNSLLLSARGNGHVLSYEPIDEKSFRFTISGENALSGDNGKVFEIPIKAPTDIQAGINYPISVTHGIVVLKNGVKVPVLSRDGVLNVNYAAEGELYARYSYDKFNNRVMFKNQSSEVATSFEWDFGDGTTSTEKEPLHAYTSPGTYPVKLTVSNGNESVLYEQNILINDQSTWEASGNLYLTRTNKGIRNFESLEDLLKTLSNLRITGDLIINVEGGQTFKCSDGADITTALTNIYQQLSDYGAHMFIQRTQSDTNAQIEFGEEDISSYKKEFVDIIVKLGKLQTYKDVDMRLWGISFNPSELYRFVHQEVCTGTRSKAIEFSSISPDLQYSWSLTKVFESLSGVLENGTHAIPSMNIINEGNGDAILEYMVTASKGSYEFAKFTVKVIIHPALNGLFSNIEPKNGTQFDNTNITLSWNNIQNALYDVYLWNANENGCDTPIIESTSNIRANIAQYCQNGGAYKWFVRAHNYCNEVFSDTLSFNVGSLPDLHVSEISIGNAVAGEEVEVSWTVTNDGNGPANNQWTDNIWLVPDVYVGTNSVYLDLQRFHPKLLKTVGNIKALAPGESYENKVQIQLEERIYGDYWIIVTTDMHDVKNIRWQAVNNAVPNPYTPSATGVPYNYLYAETNSSFNKISEANEPTYLSDNFSYAKIKIAVPGLVDLTVTDITAVVNNEPGTFTSELLGTMRLEPTPHTVLGIAESMEFYSGKWLTVTATIKNIGALKLDRTTFSNTLYMSHSPNRDSMDDLMIVATKDATTFLDPEGTTKVSFDVKVPYEWSGETYFHMFADVNDVVYELASKQNNWGNSKCYNFKLTPSADFVPSNLKAPKTIISGTPFNIQYNVKNIGPSIPTNSRWVDQFYLSKKETFDETAFFIGKVIRGGFFHHMEKGNPGGPVLIPASDYTYYGDHYDENTNVTIDNIEDGEYYLYVKVDAENSVIEPNGENNNLIRSNMISCRRPNLQAEIISIDSDTILTSSTIAISWKIKNTGKGVAKNVKTKDLWYASKNQDGADPILLGEFENELFINPGDEQILRANVKIPQDARLDGVQYIFMKINAKNEVLETDYADNQTPISKAWFHFYQEKPKIVKGTNICLANINMPSEGCPNETITISYTLRNDGNKKVDREISQEIYLSEYNSLNQSAIKCRIVSQQGSSINLGAEDETIITLKVEIPGDNIGGAKFLHFVLDQKNELQETYTKDNYVSVPFYVNGNLPLFELSNMQIPDTIMSSDDVTIKWTTTNKGEWMAKNIKVGVFRSDDGEWSKQDELLTTITIPTLNKGASIVNSATINIPDRNHGKWNIFIKADYNNDIVQLVKNAGILVKPVTVALSPIPDLVVTSLSADGTAWSGQKITLTTKYMNQGMHTTRQTRWSEDYYLAQSNILNPHTAIKIGSKVHVGALKPGEEYKSILSLTLPPNVEGNYMIFAVVDGGDAIYENNENNNHRSIPVFVNGKNVCATDLVVANISAPSKINAGQMFTLKYNIKNQGEFQAKGMCREVIYLSKDDVLDIEDPIVGTVSGNVDILPGGSETRAATGRITNVPEGRYYLLVKTNATRSIAELNDENNTTLLASQLNVAFPSITLSSSTSFNTSGYYKLTIPDGFENKSIGFYLNQSKENIGGLYVSYESVPTTAIYDECSTRPFVEQQEVIISNVRKGNYYILAQDNSTAINRDNLAFSLEGGESVKQIPLSLSTKELHFGASSLSIQEGGNGGWLSTQINGAFLDSIMDFRLVNKDKIIPVETLHFKSTTSSVATFNLNDAAIGQYDVVSELPDGTKSTLQKAFSVVPSTSVNVEVKVEAPTTFRPRTYTPMTFYYFNNGTNDVELYEFMITIQYGYIAETMDGLEKNKQKVLHIRPDYEKNRRGYISLPPGEKIAFTFFVYNGDNTTNDLIIYVVK